MRMLRRPRIALHAQRRADQALARARASLAQAGRACTSPAPSPSSTPSVSRTPVPGSAPSAAATPSPPGPPSPAQRGRPSPAPTLAPAPGNCAHATRQVLAAETTVLHAQQALARQLSALGTALPSGNQNQGPGFGPGGGAVVFGP